MNRKGSNLEERKVQTTRSGQGDSPVTRIGKTSIKENPRNWSLGQVIHTKEVAKIEAEAKVKTDD